MISAHNVFWDSQQMTNWWAFSPSLHIRWEAIHGWTLTIQANHHTTFMYTRIWVCLCKRTVGGLRSFCTFVRSPSQSGCVFEWSRQPKSVWTFLDCLGSYSKSYRNQLLFPIYACLYSLFNTPDRNPPLPWSCWSTCTLWSHSKRR